VHFQRKLLARVGKSAKPVVGAVVKCVVAAKDRDKAQARGREVADSLQDRFRDVAVLRACALSAMGPRTPARAGRDVFGCMAFDESLRAKLPGTKPLERGIKAIKRRTYVVGAFPNRAAVIRRVGARMPEQNAKWAFRDVRRAIGTTVRSKPLATCRCKSRSPCAPIPTQRP